MRIKGVGIDLVSISKITHLFRKYKEQELLYLYSQNELAYFKKLLLTSQGAAISFSGKEAVGKALGIGLGGLCPYEIEIFPQTMTLQIYLQHNAAIKAQEIGISRWHGEWKNLGELILVTVIAQ